MNIGKHYFLFHILQNSESLQRNFKNRLKKDNPTPHPTKRENKTKQNIITTKPKQQPQKKIKTLQKFRFNLQRSASPVKFDMHWFTTPT